MNQEFEQVDKKAHTVLQCIHDGHNDIQKITEATTLENPTVNYRFEKLANLKLIEVWKPDGRVTRTINGQKRNFEAPKTAALTDTGEQYLEEHDDKATPGYEDLSHNQLVEKVHELEQRVDELEDRIENYRRQILSQL